MALGFVDAFRSIMQSPNPAVKRNPAKAVRVELTRDFRLAAGGQHFFPAGS